MRKGGWRIVEKLVKYYSSVFFPEGKLCFTEIRYKLKLRKHMHSSFIMSKHTRYSAL